MRILAAAMFALALGIHAAHAEDAPLAALPYTPGLDTGAMDRDAPPCVDFYQYACGGWIKANPIPADQASWDVFRKMGQDNQRFLWGILAGLADKTLARTPVQQQIGDYFAACIDEAAVEALGAAPLAAHLAAIDGRRRTLLRFRLEPGLLGLEPGDRLRERWRHRLAIPRLVETRKVV
ncbi:MAG: M13 family metallopeptidase N-terminal domain-containing protein, partial [Usitatibacter sp.]